MYIESIPNRSSPPAILLRESYRQGKKVRKRTISNLSKWPPQMIEELKKILQGGKVVTPEDIPRESGKNFGGLWVTWQIAKKLFLSKSLGNSKQALLVMIMICGRILTQGSRRHLKFWKDGQAIEEVFGITNFDEDDLYEALDWLEENQEKIEQKLFKLRNKDKNINLFLYDITSSFLEGQFNELAEYGYNRDGKRGKKQIVIGLITDKDGSPVAIEVFKGNTTDSTTVAGQVQKLADRFGVKDVIFVGDRGMVKKAGMEALNDKQWHYVTAITKPQIKSLIKRDVFQLSLFDEKLVEVEDSGIRYILRRNPVRADEIRNNRNDRIEKIEHYCKELNKKLATRPRSKEETALKNLKEKIGRFKLTKVFTVAVTNRVLSLDKNENILAEIASLDGCYVIKTDINKKDLSTKEAHSVYKNLSFVEWSFRTMKTGFLEIRPLFHRKANRTRACAMIAMFAYMILHDIFKQCQHLEIPLEAVIEKLDQIQTQQLKIAGQRITVLPTQLRQDQHDILEALSISLPKSITSKTVMKRAKKGAVKKGFCQKLL